MTKYFTRENIHIFSILTMLIGLPLSPFLMTVGQILLIANYVFDSKLVFKLKTALTNKTTLFFLLIITIHLLGLLYTSNFEYALRDLRVKWPLLYLPIIFSSTPPLAQNTWRTLFKLFGISVIIATLISTVIYVVEGFDTMTSARNISIFISHIRFSLLICLTIFVFIYFLVFPTKNEKYFTWWAIPSIAWLSVFLLILGALTGLVVFATGVIALTLYFSRHIKNYPFRLLVRMTLLGIILIGISVFTHSLARYQYKEKIDITQLPAKSTNGTPYTHYLNRQLYENGHLVYIYIAPAELKKQWNKRSSIPYDGRDNVGNELKHTLIRYLASKNLRRDSTGIAQLSNEDIKAIENGMSNHIFLNKFSLYPHLYRVFWEFERYLEGANPTGSSIIQRLYYADAGLNIYKQNLVFGVGTGDIDDTFKSYYKKTKSVLHPTKRLRSHNQYISIMVAFGTVGIILFLLAFIYPIINYKRTNIPFLILWGIAMVSMLNEDTLETQAGTLLVALFFSLFHWGIKEKTVENQKKENNK